LLPSLITTGSLFCGCLAIVRIFEGGQLAEACWLIVFAAVLDTFDGMIARLTHTESEFGLNYDSLSDLVVFGVAPAALFLSATTVGGGKASAPTTAFCMLYIICAALRLARFNVQAAGHESKNFSGLPVPGAAGAAISVYWVSKEIEFLVQFLPLFGFVLAFLMVSNISYPSLKSIQLKDRKPFDFLAIFVVLAVLIYSQLSRLEFLLFIGFWGYIAWGLLRFAYTRFARAGESKSPEKEIRKTEAASTGEPSGPSGE
jgi:CDP-diacylglycerol--serine O-phosphatidyltransferase